MMADKDHAKIRFSWPGVLFEYDGTEAGAKTALDEFWKLHDALNPRESITTDAITIVRVSPEARDGD